MKEASPAPNDSRRTIAARFDRRQGINWGVPNGLNLADYESFQSWDETRWRWEFLRRRQEVRTAYQFLAFAYHRELTGEFGIPLDLIWQPDFRERSFFLSAPDAARLCYGRLANPLYSTFADSDALLPSLVQRTLVPWHIGYSGNKLDVIGVRQIAIVFDLDKPISQQITGLAEYLLSQRGHSIPNDIERTHQDKWPTYLRLLDARASGISWQQCADYIAPASTAQSVGTARDMHKQALRLQEHL